MKCPACGAILPDDAAFCGKCGKVIDQSKGTVFCKKCGAKLPADAVFCSKCGTVQANIPRPTAAPAAPVQKPRGKGHIVVLCLLLAALLIVGIIAGVIYYFVSAYNQSFSSSSITNEIISALPSEVQSEIAEVTSADGLLLQTLSDANVCQLVAQYMAQPGSYYTAAPSGLPSSAAIAGHIADFDGDGQNELLLVKYENEQLIYEMYEAEGDSVVLSSSVAALAELSTEEAAIDTFITQDPANGVFLQYYSFRNHTADGLLWCVQSFRYDGSSFSSSDEVSIVGSSIEPDTLAEIQNKASALGLPALDVWTKNMLCSQSDELNLISRISIEWVADSNDFYTWYNGAQSSPYQVGIMYLGGADTALPESASAMISDDSPQDVSADENSGYILPQSSTQTLTQADLRGLSAWEARLARNEILARHGRRFDTPEIQAYFDSCSWYNGTTSASAFNYGVLSKLEQQNVEVIKAYEVTLK